MVGVTEIRQHLADWLEGRISLEEFEDWFVPATWDIHRSKDAEAEELTDEIELNLSEYTSGHLSPCQLRESLGPLARRASVHASDAVVAPDIRRVFRNTAVASSKAASAATAHELLLRIGARPFVPQASTRSEAVVVPIPLCA